MESKFRGKATGEGSSKIGATGSARVGNGQVFTSDSCRQLEESEPTVRMSHFHKLLTKYQLLFDSFDAQKGQHQAQVRSLTLEIQKLTNVIASQAGDPCVTYIIEENFELRRTVEKLKQVCLEKQQEIQGLSRQMEKRVAEKEQEKNDEKEVFDQLALQHNQLLLEFTSLCREYKTL